MPFMPGILFVKKIGDDDAEVRVLKVSKVVSAVLDGDAISKRERDLMYGLSIEPKYPLGSIAQGEE
jgi:hypothetical protein